MSKYLFASWTPYRIECLDCSAEWTARTTLGAFWGSIKHRWGEGCEGYHGEGEQ